ncbi:MAG: PEP-utilizing enzyme [Patescibacteria group bacterium]|jgi:phosphohistidine swiveling domain-containing protein
MTFDFIQSVQTKYDPKAFELEPGSNFYSVAGRRIVLLARCLYPFGYSHSGIYQAVFGFSTRHKPIYDSWKHLFVDKNAMEYEKQAIVEKMGMDVQYPIVVAQKCEELGESLYAFSKDLKRMDIVSKTDVELKELAQNLFDLVVVHSSFLIVPLSLQGRLESDLLQALSQRIEDQGKKEEYFLALTTPLKPNWGYFEQQSIMRLARQYRDQKGLSADLENKIKEYLFEYDHQGTKYGYGDLWKYEDVLERLKFISTQADLDEKILRLEALPGHQDKEVQRVLKILKADKELIDMVERTRTYVYLRTYRTDVLSAVLANAFVLFGEIGQRNNLTTLDVLESLPNEILTFQFPKQADIRQRAQASVVRPINGKIYIAVGDEAKRISDNILNAQTPIQQTMETKANLQEIKGSVANPGLVRGIVSIVSGNTELGKVKPGNVLVAVMTTPDFVPAMEKASAFVTDEGGILCHAAIVSREMSKPCIIGTKIATKVLHDGDEVEVDADKGIVRIIKN